MNITRVLDNQMRQSRLLWARQQIQTCHYCGCDLRPNRRGTFGWKPPQRTVDHAVPLSRGGADAPHNWRVCCLSCNQKKANRTEEEYKRKAQP